MRPLWCSAILAWPHHQKAHQLEVVDSRDVRFQEAGGSGGEEAVDVFFRLLVDDRLDGAGQQLRRLAHVAAVLRLLVVGLTQRAVRGGLALADLPHVVERLLRLQVSLHDAAVVGHVHHVERVDLVLCALLKRLVHVPEDENDARLVSLHHGVDARGRALDLGVRLVVFGQIRPEVVQAQVGYRHAAVHVFEVHHLALHLQQLVLAVFEVALLVLVEQVVVARGGEHHAAHPAFHAAFQVDVVVKLDVGPEVHQLDLRVLRPDAVDAAEPLHDAHGVPVNVVVHQVVAVLQVLALGDAVGGYQDVDVRGAGHHLVAALRLGREAREHVVHVARNALGGGARALLAAGDLGDVQP